MKIAVPSNDQQTLSAHFGRTLGFLIFTIREGAVAGVEYRSNTFTNHMQNHHHDHHENHENHDHHDHHENHDHHASPALHSHNRILDALSDCEIVIAGGMGYRLREDLDHAGKKIFITSQSDARAAVDLFLRDALISDKDACCH